MCPRYVTNNTRAECLQYADDTTLYSACTTSQRHAFINSIEKNIQSISRWSNYANLIFNSDKKKVMVVLPPQMSKNRQLKEERIKVKCNNITLEKVPELKILGITLEEHFQLDKRISKLLKAWYFYAEKVKRTYFNIFTRTTGRIVDILQTRLLQQLLYINTIY